MAQPIEEFLLEAIQNDDKKAFDALMEKTQCGGYRLGRFPVLSLMYLYKSGRIISAYEEKFIKITSWEALREPASIAKTFSDRAGKCLRLYLSEVVSPLEMLLILDETRRLKRVYPLTKPSSGVKERLQSIYSVKYSLGIKYEGSDIILDKRPLNKKEKKKIVTICTSVALAVAIAVATPVTIVSLVPRSSNGEVTNLKQIDFEKDKTYTLENDITIPKNFDAKEMNCSIVGNGKKIIFEKGATIEKLNGKITGAEIRSYGTPLFGTVTKSAEISKINLSVTADITTTQSSAFIALTNYGLLDELNVSISGRISAVAGDSDGTEELNFGGLVLNNALQYNTFGDPYYGIIRNSTVTYSDLTLDGETYANGVFGAIVGTNSGAVGKITVKGSITSETFDISGACQTNRGRLTEIVNEATISQVSPSDSWNPIVCGIATENYGTVDYCENRGALSSKSTCGQTEDALTVCVSGISYRNQGDIAGCNNSGSITAEGSGVIYTGGISSVNYGLVYQSENGGSISAVGSNTYSGGVCAVNQGRMQECNNGGNISVQGSEQVYAGGIAGFIGGYIYKAINEGALTVAGGEVFVGGIAAYSGAQILNCIARGEITIGADTVYAGGILGASAFASYGAWGTAESCISESVMRVTAKGSEESYAGGIVGFVQEVRLNDVNGDFIGYYGGGVTKSFFVGSIQAEVTYSGSIVGACGANIYESNEYIYGLNTYNNFKDNYYVTGSAFGATFVYSDEKLEFTSPVEDKEATSLSREEIEKLEAYLSILKEFGDLNSSDLLKF